MANIIEYLDISKKNWKNLDKKIRRHLYVLIPILVDIDNKLSNFHWFFYQVKENSLVSIINEYKNNIITYKDNLVSIVLKNDDPDFLLDYIIKNEQALDFLLKNLQKIETIIISKLKSNSTQIKKADFITTMRSFWNKLDDLWYPTRNKFIAKVVDILQIDSKFLLDLTNELIKKEDNIINKLHTLQKQMQDKVSFVYAENIKELTYKIKKHIRIADGLLPGEFVNGNWHVSIDDCPRTILPKRYTKITDSFAYCKLNCVEPKKCPGFNSSQGSYISCNQLGMEKIAGAFFREIRKADQQLTEQISALSLRDPNVKLLQLEAERRDGVYYYAPLLDDNLFILLEMYPKSTVISSIDYTVYKINNEILLATKDILIAANEKLLKYIDKGEGMPKIANRPSSVIRLTFTSNARLDPAFRDYMRKLKAVKVTENTWDVPFSQEDDIEYIKNTLHDDFGYPIQVFEVVDNPEILLGNYDHYIMACVAQAKITDTVFDFQRPFPQLQKSTILSKLVDTLEEEKHILSNCEEKVTKLRVVSNNYKIGAYFVIAKTEEVIEDNNIIKIQPQTGDRRKLLSGAVVELEEDKKDGWIARDVYTGASFFIKNKDFCVTNVQACKCGPGNDIVIRLTPESLRDLLDMFNLNDSQGIYVERPIEESIEYPTEEMIEQPIGEPIEFSEMEPQKGPGIRVLVPELEEDEHV